MYNYYEVISLNPCDDIVIECETLEQAEDKAIELSIATGYTVKIINVIRCDVKMYKTGVETR